MAEMHLGDVKKGDVMRGRIRYKIIFVSRSHLCDLMRTSQD